MSQKVYEVEIILNHELRLHMSKEETYYLVKWKGYDNPADNTWEPRNGLQHLDMLNEYEKLHNIIGGINGIRTTIKSKIKPKPKPKACKKIKIKVKQSILNINKHKIRNKPPLTTLKNTNNTNSKHTSAGATINNKTKQNNILPQKRSNNINLNNNNLQRKKSKKILPPKPSNNNITRKNNNLQPMKGTKILPQKRTNNTNKNNINQTQPCKKRKITLVCRNQYKRDIQSNKNTANKLPKPQTLKVNNNIEIELKSNETTPSVINTNIQSPMPPSIDKELYEIEKDNNAFISQHMTMDINMTHTSNNKQTTDIVTPPPPKICQVYTKVSKKKCGTIANTYNNNNARELLEMPMDIKWTNVFRIFGCDNNALIIQSVHDITHVKTSNWDELLPNNSEQIQESLSLSTPTSIIASNKNENDWTFCLCIEERNEIIPMIKVCVHDIPINIKQYKCDKMIYYQTINKLSSEYCQYLLTNDINDMKYSFKEDINLKFVESIRDRNKNELDLFQDKLNKHNIVFMNPNLFDGQYIIGMKVQSIKYSFGGECIIQAVIMKVLKPYTNNTNLFSFHHDQSSCTETTVVSNSN